MSTPSMMASYPSVLLMLGLNITVLLAAMLRG
jgi:hypothetical protein